MNASLEVLSTKSEMYEISIKSSLSENLYNLEETIEPEKAKKVHKKSKHKHSQRLSHPQVDERYPEKYDGKKMGNKNIKTKYKEILKCPSIVNKYEETEEMEADDEPRYSLKSNKLMELGPAKGKKPSDPLAGIYEKDTIYMTKFLKRIKDQCELLDKLMNCIRYAGSTVKYIFEGLVDVATKRIVYVSNECQNEELAFNEILNFEALYRRLKRACKDFLQIHVEEYREHSKNQKDLCIRFLAELDEIYVDQNVPECCARIKKFIQFLEKEDERILELKGEIWDDKPKAIKRNLRNFNEKQEWVMRVILEVLADIKARYFSEWISKEDEQLNNLMEDFKKKCSEKIQEIKCQAKEISRTGEIIKP